MDPKDPIFLRRFWDKVYKSRSGCWNWTAKANTKGFGILPYKGRRIQAHRASFALAHGPLEETTEITHTCQNPLCCNPAHLIAIKVEQEPQQRPQKPRRDPAYCKRGHPYTPENTGRQRSGRYCKRCDAERKRRERKGGSVLLSDRR